MRFISYSLIPLASLLALVNASSLLVKADLASRQACSIVNCETFVSRFSPIPPSNFLLIISAVRPADLHLDSAVPRRTTFHAAPVYFAQRQIVAPPVFRKEGSAHCLCLAALVFARPALRANDSTPAKIDMERDYPCITGLTRSSTDVDRTAS
ncbi:hypothetical protein C8J57DRAFT_1589141 [Mycena rebaudengoi]|nr:hypothetical protein C8J57DRAFT_1589141 [Mycena rebaudengoi]